MNENKIQSVNFFNSIFLLKMKTRRKSLMDSQKKRESLPVKSRAWITNSQIQDLERKNTEYSSKIVEFELKIQNLNKKNAQIEQKKAQSNDASILKDEINELTTSIDKLKKKSQANIEKVSQLDSKISSLCQEYLKLSESKNKNSETKSALSITDQKLREQSQEIETLSSNLLELNKKISSLDGFEWITQKKELENDIESSTIAIQEKKDEIFQIKQEIDELQQKQVFLKPIVSKWKGKALPDSTPIENIDELMRKLSNKLKQPPPETKDLQSQLQEIVKENERKREQIFKERKKNAKRVRDIQQALVQVKKQNREEHDKAAIEEQKLIQRILALKEEDS